MPRTYISSYQDGRKTDQHTVIAENILGRRLPVGAEVHHIDFNGRNNDHSNLVICPSLQYHRLLHVRTKALKATGNANLRWCSCCKKWDEPKNMSVWKSGQTAHKNCRKGATK